MGATCCNLFFREEHAGAYQRCLPAGDRLCRAGNGWLMALSESRNPQAMAKAIRGLPGDALLFYWFDDDFFQLALYRGGKRTALLESSGKSSGLRELAALLPEDNDAAKKLRLLTGCATLEEQLALLEETFGLPFYALHEQEDIPPVPKGRTIYDSVRQRQSELKKRPNQYALLPLAPESWPASIAAKMELLALLSREMPGVSASFLLSAAANDRAMTQPGRPWHVLFPTYMRREEDSGACTGSNTVFSFDGHSKRLTVFSLPFSVGETVMLNQSGHLICTDLTSTRLLCLNQQGETLWSFAPVLRAYQRLECVPLGENGLICYTRISPGNDALIWRLNPENGEVLARQAIPAERQLASIRQLPEPGLLLCYTLGDNTATLMDGRLREVQSWPLGERNMRLDAGCLIHGRTVCCADYRMNGGWSLRRLSLDTGELTAICLEIPAYVHSVLSDGSFVCLPESGNALIVLDENGRVVSQHRLKGALLGLWTEDGMDCAAVLKAPAGFDLSAPLQTDSLLVCRLQRR